MLTAAATAAQRKTIEPKITDVFNQVLQAIELVQREATHAEALSDYVLQKTIPKYQHLLADLTPAATQKAVPPSGAIAGAYALVDASRGVWKAPANINITGVLGLTHNISASEQAELNVDTHAGLSINAIREFSGRGILVWGARTLAGNDDEWRYISIGRLFIMVENYLTALWRQGALAGTTTDDAFFVNVGLGSTMTAQDILDGQLVIEIGMAAAVRPAEFITLRLSHELQEA